MSDQSKLLPESEAYAKDSTSSRSKSNNQRRRDRQRMANKRVEQGDRYVAEDRRAIMKELGIGSSALFEGLRDLSEKTGIPVVVSARGIGLATASLAKTAATFKRPPLPQDVPVIPFFRAGLYLCDQKMALASREGSAVLRGVRRAMPRDLNFGLQDILAHTPLVPSALANIVNAIGAVDVDGVTCVPVYPPAKTIGRGDNVRIYPDPANVNIGNLHDVLSVLGRRSTPERVRRDFFRNNPIPGIEWANDVLATRPEVIIQEDYSAEDFRADMQLVYRFCLTHERQRDGWLKPLSFPTSGSRGLTCLRVKSSCHWALPSANPSALRDAAIIMDEPRMWSATRTTVVEWAEAAVYALTQSPKEPSLDWPGYEEGLHPYRNEMDVRNVFPLVNSGMIV